MLSDNHQLTIFSENFVRYGHQMCTKNRCHGPTPKYRGIKRKENEEVHSGETIVTQRIIRVLPGMNVIGVYDLFKIVLLLWN